MKFFSKIGISLLLAIAISAFPGSAWEQSFEGHPDDADIDNFVSEDFTITATGHNNVMRDYCDTSTRWLDIFEHFNGYVGFDIMADSTSLFDIGFTARNNSNVVLYDGYILNDIGIGGGAWNTDRIEIIVNPSETGFDVYRNGVFMNSFSFTASGYDGEGRICLYIRTNGPGLNFGFDNICTEPAMIGMDESASYLENFQYYNVGLAHPSESYWFTRLYDPYNTLLSSQNVTRTTIYSINLEDFTYSGNYKLRLYQHDNITNSNYFYAERSFEFDTPSSYSITLDKDSYTPGEQMEIFTMMATYSSGHKVAINYKTASGYTSYTYDVISDDQTKTWTIPSDAQGGSFFAYFRDNNDNVVAYDSFEITAPLGSTSLTLDKSTYENNDTVKITYKYLPEDSDITLILRSGTTNTYTESWRDLSGSGVKTFPIAGRAGDSIYVKAVTPVDGGTNIVLKEVTAKILSGEGYISGKIYDSSTNTPVSGATITIGGSSTTSNSLGEYEMSVLMGTQPVTITKDGYNQYAGQVLVHSLSSTKNFYLVKSISTGSDTLYGTITDYYTGAPLTSTYIQIKNGSTVLSALSHSKTGNYLFDQDSLAGEWEVTVTKTGYDTHTRIVTISGDTYLGIRLVPVGGSPVPGDEDQTDPSTPGGTTPTDRPGREAAKESMAMFETLVPGLIGIALLRVLMELLT